MRRRRPVVRVQEVVQQRRGVPLRGPEQLGLQVDRELHEVAPGQLVRVPLAV